jgi:hypothetical protein
MWPGGHGCARVWRVRAQLPARDGLRARAWAQGLACGHGFVNPLPVGNAPVAIYKCTNSSDDCTDASYLGTVGSSDGVLSFSFFPCF